MLTSEIYQFLLENIADSLAFIYVTSIDKLPVKFSLPLYMVVNEDLAENPGTHWCMVYINKQKRGIFVDSFGRQPLHPIKQFLEQHSASFQVSTTHLQMTSSTMCGAFSAIALVWFSRGKTLLQFLSNFNEHNRFLNEIIIKNMLTNDCINKFKN